MALLALMHLFLFRRNRVQAAVAREWPGNTAPVLKGNKENLAKLDHLVNTLMVDCAYKIPSLAEAYFGPKAIKSHALAVLNERRRQIHSGHDYETVSDYYHALISMPTNCESYCLGS